MSLPTDCSDNKVLPSAMKYGIPLQLKQKAFTEENNAGEKPASNTT